eukprot:363428-Chlamydomonas_euryale.AAC.11
MHSSTAQINTGCIGVCNSPLPRRSRRCALDSPCTCQSPTGLQAAKNNSRPALLPPHWHIAGDQHFRASPACDDQLAVGTVVSGDAAAADIRIHPDGHLTGGALATALVESMVAWQ